MVRSFARNRLLGYGRTPWHWYWRCCTRVDSVRRRDLARRFSLEVRSRHTRVTMGEGNDYGREKARRNEHDGGAVWCYDRSNRGTATSPRFTASGSRPPFTYNCARGYTASDSSWRFSTVNKKFGGSRFYLWLPIQVVSTYLTVVRSADVKSFGYLKRFCRLNSIHTEQRRTWEFNRRMGLRYFFLNYRYHLLSIFSGRTSWTEPFSSPSISTSLNNNNETNILEINWRWVMEKQNVPEIRRSFAGRCS